MVRAIPRKSKAARKRKSEKKTLKGWAEGVREDLILRPNLARYIDAAQRGWLMERKCLADICTQFHVQVSPEMDDDDDPDIPLANYDPSIAYDFGAGLSEEARVKRLARIGMLNRRIRRWLKYRARKITRAPHCSMDPRRNVYACLLAKLAGFGSKPPKGRSARQQFQVEEGDRLRALYKERWAAEVLAGTKKTTSKQTAHWRSEVVGDEFDKLTQAEQDRFKEAARSAAEEVRAAYDQLMDNGPAHDPESRQKAINQVAAFMMPILGGLLEYTGLHATLLIGGPTPAFNGEIRVHSLSVGTNHGATPASFPEADPEGFRQVRAIFASCGGKMF